MHKGFLGAYEYKRPIGQILRSCAKMSFLGLEGLHVFITGAAGGIGGQAVQEFLGT